MLLLQFFFVFVQINTKYFFTSLIVVAPSFVVTRIVAAKIEEI